MRFEFMDRVLERAEDRLVSVRAVTSGEEYLQDHFAGFPVLPGVLMLESMVQAARLLLDDGDATPWVLGRVRALKYGRFVTPGSVIRIEVTRTKRNEDGSVELRGEVLLTGGGEPAPVAASGRLSMRRARPFVGVLPNSAVGPASGPASGPERVVRGT